MIKLYFWVNDLPICEHYCSVFCHPHVYISNKTIYAPQNKCDAHAELLSLPVEERFCKLLSC